MLRALVLIFGLYVVAQVLAYEQKMIMIENENVLCGPITCQLNLTSMCFFTTKVTHDSKNGTYLTTCGTCLMANGTTLRESCNTEPETVGNVTNSVAVGITNQTLNTDRMKQTLSAVLMSEMAQANGNPANGIPAYGPSVSYTTPPTPYGQGGPVIVVQPPAQQIYFGNGPFDGTLLNRPPRSPNADCYPNCDGPAPSPSSSQNFQPNVLPPQLNEAFNSVNKIRDLAVKLEALLRDMSAGAATPYISNFNTNDPGVPPVKQNFPVFTPGIPANPY